MVQCAQMLHCDESIISLIEHDRREQEARLHVPYLSHSKLQMSVVCGFTETFSHHTQRTGHASTFVLLHLLHRGLLRLLQDLPCESVFNMDAWKPLM